MLEPVHDLAHLAHVELYTPRFEESLRFFVEIMGMSVSGQDKNSAYLRAYDDYEFHTLKLTPRKTAGMGHVAFRCWSQPAFLRRVAVLEKMGAGLGFVEGDLGHGKAYQARNADGHIFEIYYDTNWYEAQGVNIPALKNQAQRFPARGCNVRRLDHLNLLVLDPRETRLFLEQGMGMRTTEQIILDSGEEAGNWLTCTNKTYDIAFTKDHTDTPGRFHHVTYAVDCREDILRAADVFLENGVHIETGPHKHAVQQTFFLYVYEPGGNRIEIANAGARLMLAPDWKPIQWSETERKKGQAWGLKTVESFHTHGTPPVVRP